MDFSSMVITVLLIVFIVPFMTTTLMNCTSFKVSSFQTHKTWKDNLHINYYFCKKLCGALDKSVSHCSLNHKKLRDLNIDILGDLKIGILGYCNVGM